jgi:hypothetical protein
MWSAGLNKPARPRGSPRTSVPNQKFVTETNPNAEGTKKNRSRFTFVNFRGSRANDSPRRGNYNNIRMLESILGRGNCCGTFSWNMLGTETLSLHGGAALREPAQSIRVADRPEGSEVAPPAAPSFLRILIKSNCPNCRDRARYENRSRCRHAGNRRVRENARQCALHCMPIPAATGPMPIL